MNIFLYMTPQEIYEKLKGGPGSATLYEAQRISHMQSDREGETAGKIVQLVDKIYSGWQGSAAEAAEGAAKPLAWNALRGAGHLVEAQDLLDRQAGSFERAANSVMQMPETRPETTIFDDMVPWETDTEKAVKAYQADAHHNIQVFEEYDNASTYNETNMPREYQITNHSGGTITVTGGDRGGTSGGDDDRRSGGESGGLGGPGNYSKPAGGDPTGYPGGPTGGAPGDTRPGGSSGSQTSPNEYRPAPAPSYPPGGYPQSPAAHQSGTVPPGGFVPGPMGGYPSGSGGGAGPGGGSGGGSAGGPGARPLGPGGSAGALAAEEAARRGAIGGAAAGGRGGMAPMGAPMGAGRGRGDDDEEHTPKVLIEADAEGTFGSDVLTAPPVIGDEDDEE